MKFLLSRPRANLISMLPAAGFIRMPVAGLLLCLSALVLHASDHADVPHSDGVLLHDANLTDLHAFVRGENLVIALSCNPAIPPGDLHHHFPTDVTFEIHLDNHTQVSSEDPLGLGGTILDDAKIHQDFTIRIRFDESGQADMKTFVRGGKPKDLTVEKFFAGLRDDPFIRGPRIGRNVAAIVLEVPLAAVTPNQSTLLIWATSKVQGVDGPVQDLVGRALRSMMMENVEMNTMQPKHQLRQMGVLPDVMIYDTSRPASFPNGRALEDDVVDLIGDPRILGNDSPFPDTNDVPFLTGFPYLAPPQ